MKKIKILFVVLIILITVWSVLFFWKDLVNLYWRLTLSLPKIEEGVSEFLQKEIEKQVSTPPPLRAKEEAPESFLTRSGVIEWTNVQRAEYGFPPLRENEVLNTAAEKKMQDMFQNQYFAHYSPLGIGVGDLAQSIGYEFLAIGENLALGNFQNDQALVEAWVASPGHRDNILNNRYQEIGVAVGKGTFEGKSTWIAVQHFALPLSVCSQPDEALKIKIETNQSELANIEEALRTIQAELQSMKIKSKPLYNQKVKQYNILADKYNTLAKETEILVKQYNNQVKLFNKCAVGAQ